MNRKVRSALSGSECIVWLPIVDGVGGLAYFRGGFFEVFVATESGAALVTHNDADRALALALAEAGAALDTSPRRMMALVADYQSALDRRYRDLAQIRLYAFTKARSLQHLEAPCPIFT